MKPNLNPSSPETKLPLTLSDVRTQLVSIGKEIEGIAKNLESKGAKIDCEGLYEAGSKIEHFLDQLESEKLLGKVQDRLQ